MPHAVAEMRASDAGCVCLNSYGISLRSGRSIAVSLIRRNARLGPSLFSGSLLSICMFPLNRLETVRLRSSSATGDVGGCARQASCSMLFP